MKKIGGVCLCGVETKFLSQFQEPLPLSRPSCQHHATTGTSQSTATTLSGPLPCCDLCSWATAVGLQLCNWLCSCTRVFTFASQREKAVGGGELKVVIFKNTLTPGGEDNRGGEWGEGGKVRRSER